MRPKIFLRICLKFLPIIFIALTCTAAALADGAGLRPVLAMNNSGGLEYHLFSDVDGVVVYQESNSWGYCCRSLFLKDMKSGDTYELRRKEKNWKHNAPSVRSVNANDDVVTDIDLCDGSWYATTRIPERDSIDGQLTPVFEILKTESKIGKTWSGKVTGKPLDWQLEKACISKLNK